MSATMDRRATAGSEKALPEAIFEYLAIIHEHGVGSPQAEQFKSGHYSDKGFRQLAKGAERLFQHKDEILKYLDARQEEDVAGSVCRSEQS
jgi:hypothetical protein